MMKFDIHFCLISGQAAPNLLPILDTEFKPQKAVFVVSKAMKKQAEHLAKVFTANKVQVEQINLEDEFDFAKTSEQLLSLVEKYEDENAALNVTGGTKLISIAAADAFNMIEKPIFYINTDNNEIIFLSKDENKEWIANKPLNTNITLSTYLAAYGKGIKTAQYKINSSLLEPMQPVIKYYDKYKDILPSLNFAAAEAEKNKLKYEFDKKFSMTAEFEDFLNELDFQRLIDYNGRLVHFKNEETRAFLNGGWLEDYVFQQVKAIKKVDDILENAELTNDQYQQNKSDYIAQNRGNKNEFDVIFLAKNKLHIIECKTQKFGKGTGQKAEDILYKLETLKDYGGLMTKKCLVSYFEVPEAVSNRAKSLNIHIIQGKDIARLKQLIQEWIAK
ncbi:Card1-like endonuclease domain-containing protein [Avibacterium avium]|uniref:Card1-like endonuclease domain-containing protein n=1 Tax=Avibacterium avium TaxID=751 RepID=UPI003BF84847